MKKVFRAGMLLALVVGANQDAAATILNSSRGLGGAAKQQISFRAPTLAPLAFVKFCMRYQSECHKPQIMFRGGPVKLTAERYAELIDVNRAVNVAIRPQPNLAGVAGEEWIINPSHGDCNDYAVSKKHQLRARGWPERSMFLSEVVTNWGEHHLILVVRTDKGDLILDNLTGAIKPVGLGRYQWVRAQHPGNPIVWHEISQQTVNS